MIIETSDNRFYRVYPTSDKNLAHVWYGVQVAKRKGERGNVWLAKDRKHPFRLELVRKAATRVVEA